jgi:hypothetical protein
MSKPLIKKGALGARACSFHRDFDGSGGPRAPVGARVNLETHITDVVNLMR